MGTVAQIAPLSTTELASQLGRLEQRFEERLSKLETENKLLRAQLPQLHDASTQLPEFSSTMRTFGRPCASTVANAMALGSEGSTLAASSSHACASANGSSPAKMPVLSSMMLLPQRF